jgi:hypothetical protein
MSLHRHHENGVKYFSGTATYTNSFTVPAYTMGGGKKIFMDLGRVEILAQVKINGRDQGIFWTQPYRIDITDAVQAGENRLEVQVTNLWPNRLIGDEQLPPENKYVGGMLEEYPDWYINGEPKPVGGRVTFTTYKHYSSDSPLLESGLIGPVALRSAYLKEINF